jgi:hypothetical protein
MVTACCGKQVAEFVLFGQKYQKAGIKGAVCGYFHRAMMQYSGFKRIPALRGWFYTGERGVFTGCGREGGILILLSGIPHHTKRIVMNRFLILFMLLASCAAHAQQTMLDDSDSAANHLRQYIIRFDVANGNIYVPVKKKMFDLQKNGRYFKRIPFLYKKDSVVVTGIDKIVRTIKFEDGKQVEKIDTVYKKRIVRKPAGEKYLEAGKFFKPKVGSFIRLIFENVPKGMDVAVRAEFVDKNLENAATFDGFLNRYLASVDSAVGKDAAAFAKLEKLQQAAKAESELQQKILEKQQAQGKKELERNIELVNEKFSAANKEIAAVSVNRRLVPVDLNKVTRLLKKAGEYVSSLPNSMFADSAIGKVPDTLRLKYLNPALQNLQATQDRINANGRSYNDLVAQFNTLIWKSDSVYNITKQQFDSVYKVRMTVQAHCDTLEMQLAALRDSINYRGTIYIQPIQVVNSDITLLKIIYRKDDKAQNDVYREVMLKNRYGFKLDFSTGFIGTGLRDENYRLVPTPGTVRDTSTIVEDPKGSFAIGFAIMTHAYVRTGERVNLALNTGLMLNSSNQTINYLAGLSLPLGLEQRLVISGGWAFGKVKRLTTGFEPDKPYPASQLNLSAGVPYTEKWRSSYYFGVSYNLSGLTSSQRKVVVAR